MSTIVNKIHISQRSTAICVMICNISKKIKNKPKCQRKIVEIVKMPGMIIMDLQQNKLYQREQKCQRNEYIITDRKKKPY